MSDERLRIGIAMLTLVPGEMGGSEVVARSLCRALAASPAVDARAFVTEAAPGAGEGLPTEIVTELPAGGSPASKLVRAASGLARRRAIGRRFAGLDAVHYPFTVPLPPLSLPTVVTLHDLQHRDLPELFGRALRRFRAVAYDRAARRADAVVVPSAFVRDRALALLALDPGRVHVVPHGVDHALFAPAGEPREAFLLYPARTWPHKNHARLLEAFALVRRRRPGLSLVLTGGGTEALAGPAGVDARGPVPLGELASLYRRAACVVFPSLYEGFGSPPLEAMACGAPVAASAAGSLPEVCGAAAVLFDPYDPEAIAAGVEEALDRAGELSRAGLERAAAFTWEASARGHVRAYEAAAARRR